MSKLDLTALQAFPELRVRIQPEVAARSPSSASPTAGFVSLLNQEYTAHSPGSGKRRRLSNEDGQDGDRFHGVPRQYSTPSVYAHQPSPPMPSISAPESWASSSRHSPVLSNRPMAVARSPMTMEVNEPVEPRPALPTLPRFTFEREFPHSRGPVVDEYPPRASLGHSLPRAVEHPSLVYRTATFPYYGHANRMQSLSLGSIGHYEHIAPNPAQLSALNADNKQRKRRGNLPKETTDKLRSWFLSHLHHPYPTEEEKQTLMRQTGLQMSKPSIPSCG